MTKLTVAIASYNGEDVIEGAIKSAKFADEIVVVDGQSGDKTAKIAKDLGAKVYSVENTPLMKKNMNLSFQKATGDWIMSLDADERISGELANEIIMAIKEPKATAYKMPRKNLFFGKYLEHTGWYPDFQTRLFQRGKARFPEKNVHEELEVDGNIGELINPIEHQHYRTVSEWLGKLDNYTSKEAEKLISEKRQITWHDAINFPLHEFMRRFFAWEGYKDGLHGLVLSILMAFYWELIFVKIWEHQKFWQHQSDNFLSEVSKESKKVSKEFHHWAAEKSSHRLSKISHKIKKHL